MPGGKLTWATLTMLGSCIAASPALARSAEAEAARELPDPEVVEESEQAIDLRPFELGVRFGPSFGWYMGAAHLELDAGIRLTETLHLVPAARVAGGLGTDDRNYLEFGGDLGIRVGRPKRVSGVGHFGAGAIYLGEIREGGGISHFYAVPYGRIGGGIRLVGDGRFAWGVEGAARFGYAVHRNPELVDPVTGVSLDRSSFYGNLDLSLVLSF
jgi:hypothetical protein